MAKSFDLLKPVSTEWTLGNGTIINQYPTKLYLSENLIALPISYL